jgi:Ca-activated chloride channel family protein
MKKNAPLSPPAGEDAKPGFAPVNAANGQEVTLAMQDLFVTGHILAAGARLVVRHTFVSGEKKPVEVVYAFVLPRDAALRRFKITGKDFAVCSELQPVEAARKAYEKGLADGHLATLAEQYSDGYVNLSVGNVQPGEQVQVYLEIMAGVDLRDDGLRFRFPFTLAPCYHRDARMAAIDEHTGEIELPEDEFGDLLLPPFKKVASELHRVSFDLSVTMPDAIAETASPSHGIRVRNVDSAHVRVASAVGKEVPNRDLVLDVRMQHSFAGVLGAAGADQHGYFVALIASDRFGKVAAQPRRVVFLVDRSGSMAGGPIAQARNAVLACLGALDSDDEVGVVAFDNVAETSGARVQKADDATRTALQAFVKQIEARGGTELLEGIKQAAGLLGQGGDIFVLTDGQVNATEDIIQQAKSLGIRLHCLGIGSASQDRFLALLARETGGVNRFMTPHERVDLAALEMFAAVGRPVAAGIRVRIEGLTSSALPVTPPTMVFAGHPLLVFGEGTAGNGQLIIERDRAEAMTLPLELRPGKDATTLKLLQGARLITDLDCKQPDSAPGAARNREQKRLTQKLMDLGREYGLANRSLALVAVVTRAGDRAGVVPQTKIVPVGMPDGTSFDAYFGHQPSPMVTKFCMKPSSGTMFSRKLAMAAPPVSCCREPDQNDVDEDILHGRANDLRRDREGLLVELTGRIQSDGGMPGADTQDRIVASALVLLALLEAAASGQERIFSAHISRMIRFLGSQVSRVPTEEMESTICRLLERAEHLKMTPGAWLDLCKEYNRGNFNVRTAWRCIRGAIQY